MRQTKERKAERDGSVIGSRSGRLTPTKQNRPRPAENDPSTHDEIEKNVKKGRRRKQIKAMACALDPESTRMPRSNGKLSQPVRERKVMVRVLGHTRGAAFWVTPSSLGGYENFLTDGR